MDVHRGVRATTRTRATAYPARSTAVVYQIQTSSRRQTPAPSEFQGSRDVHSAVRLVGVANVPRISHVSTSCVSCFAESSKRPLSRTEGRANWLWRNVHPAVNPAACEAIDFAPGRTCLPYPEPYSEPCILHQGRISLCIVSSQSLCHPFHFISSHVPRIRASAGQNTRASMLLFSHVCMLQLRPQDISLLLPCLVANRRFVEDV